MPKQTRTGPDRLASQPDDEKHKQLRERQDAEERGGPVNDPRPLHPTKTVDESPAYRRADGSRHGKES